MRKLTLGPCPVCDKRIWDFDGPNITPNKDCAHFWVRSNYNTIAKFAICKDCLAKLDMAGVAEIIDRQAFTWITELMKEGEITNRKLFVKYRFYAALDWYKTEEEAMQKVEEIKR